MAEQRLPKVNQDDGTWGDILRQYLKKEHTDDGTDNAANGGHQHITITASDGTAGTAPIRLTSGTLLSVAAIGAIEFNNDTLYFTKTTGTTRMQVVMDTATQTLTNKTLTDPKIASTIKDANGNTILNLSGQASAVNNWIMKNRASGAGPTLEVEGTDTDIWMNVVPKGNAGVTIYQNTSGQPAKISTDGADTNININMLPKGTGRLQAGGVNVVTTSSADVLTNKTLTSPRIANNGYIADANGNEQIVFGQTASAINEIKVTNAAAGNGPTIAAQGGDTNVDLNLNTKGTGQVKINGSPIPSDANMVHKTGNETIAGDKTFSDVVTLNDITYAKEINITPTNGAPQSAAFTLDNDNGQVWQFTNNSVGDFAMWNQTAGVGPFYVEGGAPQDAFKVAEDFNYSGQRLEMDGNTIAGSVVDLHPESDGFNVFPHMVNDLAYNNLRGGSVVWKKNGVVTPPSYGADSPFAPDATMASYSGLTPGTDVIVAEVTLWRAFNWGVKWGIVMTPWCCAQNVQLEVWDNIAGTWTTAYTKTNDASGMHWASWSATSGHDMTKIRWTLSNFNNPDPRITQIAAIQYDSPLLSGTFLPRGGGDLYGPISVFSSAAGSQSAYIGLDAGVGQEWGVAQNTAGQMTIYDTTNAKTPFRIDPNAPDGSLTIGSSNLSSNVQLDMSNHKIFNLSDPTAASDAATKNYVDTTTVSPSGSQVLTNKNLTSATNTFPTFNQNTTGSAATLTTSRTFQTNLASTSAVGFNGSANNVHGVTGTLPVANGGTGATTFTAGYVLTGNATSAVTATKAAPSGAFVGTTDTQTLSSKRITPRAVAATVGASYTIDSDATDYYTVAGQNQNVTFNNPTGTPVDGQKLMVRIKDDGTPRLVGWGSNFQASGITGPLSQTVPNKEHNVLFVYSTGVSKWVCLASDSVGY